MLQPFRQRRSFFYAFCVLILLGLGAADASAQGPTFLRVLAGASPAGDSTGAGDESRFNVPAGIAIDGSGTLYVADVGNCRIKKVTAAGVVTKLAGGESGCGSVDGAGNVAKFISPNRVAVDNAGTVYVADTFNHTIRKITPAGVVSTLAGQAGSIGSVDGTGSAARFFAPRGIAVDGAGTVYVADSNNQTIRQITPAGVVTTLAGSPGLQGTTDGTGSAARFNAPLGIAVDSTGTLYVSDTSNHTIRKITAGGVVTTLAGLAGSTGNTDGTGNAARFNNPRGLAVDGAGTLFVADTNNNTIRKVTAAGVVTTLAGLAGSVGGADGTGNNARFTNPEGVTADAGGTVYVADTVNDTIRKITPGGVVTTLAGFVGSFGSTDGTGSAARFGLPFGVAIDTSRNVYVADRSNNTIRKITPAGVVTTLAGSASALGGSVDGTGSAARFSLPRAVAVDGSGTVYVADGSQTIRTITPGGVVTTLAGLAFSPGNLDGTGSAARFNAPSGIAVDGTGTLYVADGNNHTIRKITAGGVVTTLAGLAGTSGTTDGTGSAARFNFPRGVAVDNAGTVYVADSNNATIRKITPAGVVTTLAGLAGSFGGGDGTGSAARFNTPQGIAVDSAGTLYVADTNNQTIRKVTAAGVVTTVAGCPGCTGNEFYAQFGFFNLPQSVAVSPQGFLYVADSRNNTIRTTAPLPSSLVVDFGSPYGIWLRSGTTWSQLHPSSAEAFLTYRENRRHDGLIIDFGPGVGVWIWLRDTDGSDFWFQIHSLSPTAMVGIDSHGNGDVDSATFVFQGQGVWLYDGDNDVWTQLNGVDASLLAAADLDGVPGQELIADFPGYGLWVYAHGAWSQLNRFEVSSIITTDLDGNGRDDLVMDFPGFGLWSYRNGTTWSQIHAHDATRIVAGDLDGNGVRDLVIDFGAGIGVWVLQNGTTWAQLHQLTTDGITIGDLDGNGHDEVIIDFGALGVWSHEDIGGWQQLHTFNPKGIGTGHFF